MSPQLDAKRVHDTATAATVAVIVSSTPSVVIECGLYTWPFCYTVPANRLAGFDKWRCLGCDRIVVPD